MKNTSESVEGWCGDGMEITELREPSWKMTFEVELLRAIWLNHVPQGFCKNTAVRPRKVLLCVFLILFENYACLHYL